MGQGQSARASDPDRPLAKLCMCIGLCSLGLCGKVQGGLRGWGVLEHPTRAVGKHQVINPCEGHIGKHPVLHSTGAAACFSLALWHHLPLALETKVLAPRLAPACSASCPVLPPSAEKAHRSAGTHTSVSPEPPFLTHPSLMPGWHLLQR